MPGAPPRSPQQRKQDTLQRLRHDADAWIATADPASGVPYLVPLSFWWDGQDLWVATPAASPTGRNLAAAGQARLGVGPTRDVVIIEGSVAALEPAALPAGVGDSFAAAAGFDPRQLTGYRYFRIRPLRLQAWREANELPGRDLMREGEWLIPG